VQRNRGARSAGVDRITVRKIVQQGVEQFLAVLRKELRDGSFRPSPVRRVLIPKAGKPGAFRPLGIPTVKDRVIQAAMKQILEPIFEAGFYPTSYGFRPGRSVRGALAHLKALLPPRGMKRWKTAEKLPFPWAIEGDIKGCFDHIDHHGCSGFNHSTAPRQLLPAAYIRWRVNKDEYIRRPNVIKIAIRHPFKFILSRLMI